MDFLEGLQKVGQVDDTFAGQQTLVIVDLLWRQVRRVIEMDVHDAIAARGNDVLGAGSCVVKCQECTLRFRGCSRHYLRDGVSLHECNKP